jgi:hypothetical protein
MDSSDYPFVIGKYYLLDDLKVQYIGLDNEKNRNYLFKWIDNKNIVLHLCTFKTPNTIIKKYLKNKL